MPEVRPLRPGDPVAVGDYRLTGRLGEGGQGVVYLGESGSEQVAIKILHDRHDADAKARERLLREVEATRQVPPFCTAKVLDVGLMGERPYVVSEFIDGESLEHRVKNRGPLDPRALERLAIGTATALVAIHNAGIVHRDFKPANVLLASDGPRVVDFGIARALDLITSSISVMGTPPYMSPEQFSGDRVGTASDMFSWAGTMIFAATGETPFGQDAIAAVVNRVLHHEPDLSGLPESLRPIVGRCMAKDPGQRPSARDTLLYLVTGQAPESPGPVSEGELLQNATARVREVPSQPSGGESGWGPHTPPEVRPVAASGAPGFAPAGAPADAGRPETFPGERSAASSAEAPPFPQGPVPGQAPQPYGAPGFAAGASPYAGGVAPQPGQPGPYGGPPNAALPNPAPPTTAPPNAVLPNPAPPTTTPPNAALPNAASPDTTPPGYSGPATAPSAPRSTPSRRSLLIAAGLVLVPAAGVGATALGTRLLNSGTTTTPTGGSSPAALPGSLPPSPTPGVSTTASAGGTPGPTATGVSGTGAPVTTTGPTGSPAPSSSGGPTGALVLTGPTVMPHGTSVMCVAVTPDGRQVVSGAWDGKIRVWDVATGKLTAQFNDRKDYIEGLSVSPDGRLLISVGGVRDTKGKVWNLAQRKTTGKTVIGSVFAEFSPDGAEFVTGSGYEWARLWRTSDRGQIGAAMRHGILAKGAAFSPDGRVLAVASWDNTVRLWNAANASSLGRLTGHKDEVNVVTFLGPRLLASAGYDKVVRIWDVTTRKAVGSPLKGPTTLINTVAHTPQGGILACGEDNGLVWMWNATTRRRLGEPLNTSGQIKQILFTPDGRTLVVASGNDIQLWTINGS
ncbi:protein kinase [Thermopolyspora sp. NPDC052614]|uniref:WD40 repeat domain-containing serine/threonine protein kinase n=1 Tax=Thermopolyspora sp. NPDC052614 TaxID=3155682 RepID=UPI0034121EAD